MSRSAAKQGNRALGVGISTALLSALLLVASTHTTQAAGVVTTCDEAHFDAALASGGLVTFSCGASPLTITVTSTKTISADTTIDGGSLMTISGGHIVGVFSVNTGVTFTVQNLAIANGAALNGGGILNAGTLTVTNSTFSGNSAIGNGFRSVGGGIYNGGNLTISNSTFFGNSAGNGGGIYNINNGGTLTLTNSTFSGNSADSCGGGLYSGGIQFGSGSLTVTNSTFSGNVGASSFDQCGGIYHSNDTLTVTNSIIANNTNGDCGGSGHSVDGGHNLIGDAGNSCGLMNDVNGNIVGVDPMLDPAGLEDNGGPTQTIALQAGSPAINAGDEITCAEPPVNNLDQRGFVRPGTGHTQCSIGAYEAGALRRSVVGTGTAASCTDAALDVALAGGGLVTFNCGGPATIDISTGTGTKIIVVDTTVDGGGLITISGGNAVRVFSVLNTGSGVTFTVENLTIANGNAAVGGAIYNVSAAVLATKSIFSGNVASIDGGAIFNDVGISNSISGRVTITDSTFAHNRAGIDGGGIFNSISGAATITNSTFEDNHAGPGQFAASHGGGGIFNSTRGTATITNSTFRGNGADTGDGGGILNAGTVDVTNSTFTMNRAGNCRSRPILFVPSGGGIYNLGTATVTSSTITANCAIADGGIANLGTATVVINTIVANSTSGRNCAGVTDGGHNLDDGTSCGFSAANGSLSNTDPQLDPAGLQDNGGPTQTVSLCTAVGEPAGCTAASPAIDAGGEAACAAPPVNNLDQRGFGRPGIGAATCSIGAYESNAQGSSVATPTPTSTKLATATATPEGTITPTSTATPTWTPTEAQCTGDCDASGDVTVNELIILVNIDLGSADASACPNGIPSGGSVDIALIIQAVNNAMTGCGGG